MENAPSPATTSVDPPDGSITEKRPLVLVVDDQPIIVSVVERYLLTAGYDNVLAVTESRQVLPLLYSHSPDLVVMDLCMPVISGLDILIAMRHDEQLGDIPVIAMTATAGTRIEQEVRRLGVSRLVRKPLESREIVDAVRRALGEAAEKRKASALQPDASGHSG